jgi:pyrimidine-nucleoside phosphorylase
MVTPLAPVEVLERSRRGDAVDPESLAEFLEGWFRGGTDDAQMGAWCMAACAHGLPRDAVSTLCDALVASGERLELARLGPTADVQATGGVGGSALLVALPLAAALGARVATVGRRGLAHTGGLLDALGAIPGLTTSLPLDRFVRQVRDVGLAVTAGDDRLVPGEWRLAGLRGLTGTGACAGLVAASVMSAAIAGGGLGVALDVAAGSGAFVPDAGAGADLGTLMAALARPWGREVRFLVTNGDVPRGRMIGNALEVRGAGEVLRGEGADDVRAVAGRLAVLAAEACGAVPPGEGAAAAAAALADGRALVMAERWVESQGGDPGAWSFPHVLPPAPLRLPVPATSTGTLAALDALAVGEAARWLGVGRMHPVQSVDAAVGIELVATVGEEVAEGEPFAWVHARDAATGDRAVEVVGRAARVEPGPVAAPEPVLAEG